MKSLEQRIKEAEERLDRLLPEIEERQREARKKATDEPDSLKSGVRDDLARKRSQKEQDDD